MDTPEKPKRPWWRKKRWRAAAAVLLLAAYPASMGPAMYASCRGWIPREVYRGWYGPALAFDGSAVRWNPLRPYLRWWEESCIRFEQVEAWREYEKGREYERIARERKAAEASGVPLLRDPTSN